jgi:hypothetical protein
MKRIPMRGIFEDCRCASRDGESAKRIVLSVTKEEAISDP